MGMQCIEGFKSNDFEGISAKHLKKMQILIAQASETAYRRGVQQGALFYEKDFVKDFPVNQKSLANWRYNNPISKMVRIYGNSQPIEKTIQKNEELIACNNFFRWRSL
jgi:hypothetical protein